MKNQSNVISIIIVHYQEEQLLFACLESIAAHAKNTEVIIVDNGSKPGFEQRLTEKHSSVRYIQAQDNVGYGAGNNLGALIANGQWLFFLNPDTVLQKNTVEHLERFITDKPDLAIVAPTLLHPDKSVFEQQGSLTLTPIRVLAAHSIFHTIWPTNPVARKFWLADVNKSKDRQVEVVPGTAFMINKKIFNQVGRFDPQFFLYFEEYDLCRRILASDHQIWMSGSSLVIHHWEGTTKNTATNAIYNSSLKKYLDKYYGNFVATATYLLSRVSKWQILVIVVLVVLVYLAS